MSDQWDNEGGACDPVLTTTHSYTEEQEQDMVVQILKDSLNKAKGERDAYRDMALKHLEDKAGILAKSLEYQREAQFWYENYADLIETIGQIGMIAEQQLTFGEGRFGRGEPGPSDPGVPAGLTGGEETATSDAVAETQEVPESEPAGGY